MALIHELDLSSGSPKNAIGDVAIACTRASTAQYKDSVGTWQTAAINEAVIEWIGGIAYLRAEPQRTNYFHNTSTPATQTSGSLGTGTYVLWVEGAGTATVSANTASITGGGAASAGSPIVFEVTGAGTVDITISGSLDWCQLEDGYSPTSRIPTTGADVTRSADSLTWSLSAAEQASLAANGSIAASVRLGYNKADVPATNTAIISVTNSRTSLIYLGSSISSEAAYSWDGTGAAAATATSSSYAAMTLFTVGAVWPSSSGLHKIGKDTVYGAEQAFDGDYTTDNIGRYVYTPSEGTVYIRAMKWFDQVLALNPEEILAYYLTTSPPTTLGPTTLSPTTVAPTTSIPTTPSPTTIGPTTLAPTTIAPTTEAPTTTITTLAPTTESPAPPGRVSQFVAEILDYTSTVDIRISQHVVEVLTYQQVYFRQSQLVVEVLREAPALGIQLSQLITEVLRSAVEPGMRVSQQVVEVLRAAEGPATPGPTTEPPGSDITLPPPGEGWTTPAPEYSPGTTCAPEEIPYITDIPDEELLGIGTAVIVEAPIVNRTFVGVSQFGVEVFVGRSFNDMFEPELPPAVEQPEEPSYPYDSIGFIEDDV